jgi:hypothetical protein
VCGVTDDEATARDEVAATSRSGSADLWPVSGGQVGQNDRSMEGRRHWTTWIYPQKLLDVHPVLGTLGVVALVGSAAGYGAMACPSGALFVGVASTDVGADAGRGHDPPVPAVLGLGVGSIATHCAHTSTQSTPRLRRERRDSRSRRGLWVDL